MSNLKEMSLLPSEVDTDSYENQTLPSVEASLSTEYIRPVNASNRFMKFVFDNKGVLSSDSKIVLSATCSQANNDKLAYPQPCGVFSLIQKAVLKFGTRVAVMSENTGNEFAIRHSSFTSGQDQKYLSHFIYGTNFYWDYKLQGGNRNGIGHPLDAFSLSTRLHNNPERNSDFGIPLKVLFAGFLDIDLPLFFLDPSQEVSVELTFKAPNTETIGDRVVATDPTFTNAGLSNPIDTANSLMIAHYVFFSSKRTEQLRKSYEQFGYRGVFNDCISTRNALGSVGTQTAVRSKHSVGGSGKDCEGILIANPEINIASDKVKSVCGKYGSEGLDQKGMNVIVNNLKKIPIDIAQQNSEQLNNFLGSYYGHKNPELPYPTTNRKQKVGLSTADLNGVANQGGLSNSYSYMGLKFDEKASSLPVQLELNRLDADGLSNQDLVCFLYVKKSMVINPNGMVEFAY